MLRVHPRVHSYIEQAQDFAGAGDYEKAQQYELVAAQTADGMVNAWAEHARIAQVRGERLMRQTEWADAIIQWDKVLSWLQNQPDGVIGDNRYTAMHNRARCHEHLGQTKEAFTLYAEALAEGQKISNAYWPVVYTFMGLGRILSKLKVIRQRQKHVSLTLKPF